VIEAQMNHAIRLLRSTAQAFEILQIASMHLGAGVDKKFRARI